RAKKARFSAAVRSSYRASTWGAMPIWRRTSGRVGSAAPLTDTAPASGRRAPAIMWMVVVLPAPLGPSSPKVSPRASSRLTPSTATTRPYALRSPLARIMAGPARAFERNRDAGRYFAGALRLLAVVIATKTPGPRRDFYLPTNLGRAGADGGKLCEGGRLRRRLAGRRRTSGRED